MAKMLPFVIHQLQSLGQVSWRCLGTVMSSKTEQFEESPCTGGMARCPHKLSNCLIHVYFPLSMSWKDIITSQTHSLGMYVCMLVCSAQKLLYLWFCTHILPQKRITEPSYQKVENVLSSILHFFFPFIQTVYISQTLQMYFARPQAYATLTTDKPNVK